mgnify:CR=1 FL=1
MKLQNMTVIFIIIMIPIILVVSYYIGLQINTITMQKNYTVKLQTAAKDSIQALEINTVEWNSASSNLADSKRRDVLAAINTFTTSLANGMGIGGAGKGRIQTYIPAIVYTMYDGYYIYSASWMKDQDTDKDGLTQFNADGTIKSNETSSYQYILKPYSPYSARYASANGSIDVTVNYTLDNYIRVYGTVNGEYQAKEGYLVVCDDNAGVEKVSPNGSISGITYRGATIKPETLKEQVYIENKGVEEYPYIYDQYDNKLYWDKKADPNEDGVTEGNYFSVDKYNNKVYLQNALPEGDAGFSITNRFRKISIPMYDNREDEWTVQKVFQILNPGGGYKFYYENQSGAFVEFTSVENIDGSDNKKLAGVEVEKDKDFSAINYCVESYVFTKWVTKNLGSITVGDMKSPTVGQYNNVDNAKNKNIFAINPSNNPDPENDVAYATSVLAQHKKDIIINTIEKNLSQATEQAKKMNPNYEYRLPQLSYDEWEQALSNISIIAFMQGMPIGLKYYNNYAIATSTLNKEFVDPDELYFAGKDDQYYHQRQCEQATGSDYVGYRSIDYVAKSYEKSDNGTTSTKYYYPHANSTNSELECYYCLVNRSTYKNNGRWKGNLLYKNWSDSYYNALARERYMQLDEPGTYKPNVTVKKTAKPTSVEYGGEIEYTIEITNNGIVADEVIFRDDLAEGALAFVEVTRNTLGTQPDDMNGKTYLQVSNKITIDPGETKELKYKAKPSETAELGKIIKNTVTLYSYVNKDRVYDSASATTSVEKKVTIAPITNSENYNVIMILDHSNSMNMRKMKSMYSAVSKLLEENGTLYNLYTKTNMNLSIIHFNKSAKYKYEDISNKEGLKGPYKYYKNTNEFTTIFQGGTDYQEALNLAKSKLNNEFNNIIIFLTDGCPTPKLAIGTEYRIEKENEEYEYFKRTWSPGGIINKWRKDHSNTPIELWKNIANIATSIKQQNSEIYCISYGERDAEYGLKNVISSGEEYYELAEIENIEEKFNNIINNIKPLEIDTSPRYSQNGILTIEKPDKLKYIKVNGTPIEPKDLEKPIQDGKLDLTQFPIGATIELVY